MATSYPLLQDSVNVPSSWASTDSPTRLSRICEEELGMRNKGLAFLFIHFYADKNLELLLYIKHLLIGTKKAKRIFSILFLIETLLKYT